MSFTLAVLIALYMQTTMGYGPMRAAIGFIPFAFATPIGAGASSRLVTRFSPRVVVISGGILLLGAILCGSTLHRGVPYFPHLVLPIVIAGIGLGMINVPLGLALIASVYVDEVGPPSAIATMVRSLGGPLVLAVIQAAITSRTLHLGGTYGPVKFMSDAQLHALDHGFASAGCGCVGWSSSSAQRRCSSATPRSRWLAHPSRIAIDASSKPILAHLRRTGEAATRCPRDGVNQPLRRVGSFEATSAKALRRATITQGRY